MSVNRKALALRTGEFSHELHLLSVSITVFSIKSSINKVETLRKYVKVEGPWGQTAEPSPPNLNGYITKASQEGKNN